ncbi:MAG: TCP-1/cpn60 chaperonin family protein [Canidatus Methanoxibalbensis ujae]|nr:TCP-1/cpn60 chaperonin family protein [Candidatus Methanoxibalbensis ujae]MCW7078287.1 TCP-1/cpn60 chaperonin family protein [Candidatus Methanoxibalbensis ujae]
MIEDVLPPGDVPPEEIQWANKIVCEAFSDMFRSIIGPIASKKMLTRDMTKEEVVDLVSSSGYTILKELRYDHPTADILISAGISLGDDIGDGVATMMVLLGELVRNGFELRAMGVHQNTISRGYNMALDHVLDVLDDICIEFSEIRENRILRDVARTALKKSDYWSEDALAEVVVEAIKRISDSCGNGADGAGEELLIDVDDVLIEAKSGGAVKETRLLDGVLIDREVLDDLPTEMENARIALLDFPIEHWEPERTTGRKAPKEEFVRKRSKAGETLGALGFTLKIRDPNAIKAFYEKRRELFEDMIKPIIASGANVVCCRWGIDDEAIDLFRDNGIMAMKRVKFTDLQRLERATGAKIVKKSDELSEDKLGYAGKVVQRDLSGVKYVFFEDCPHKKACAILIRGVSNRVLEGIVGEVRSALNAVARCVEDPRVIPGGGAVEVECAVRLRKYARSIPRKEQFAIEAFADALESIPNAIAKNCGMDMIDTITALRAAHASGKKYAGISAVEGEIVDDVFERGIVDPLVVKEQAFIAATEGAIQMIRIEDLHIAKSEVEKEAEDIEAKIAGRTKEWIMKERRAKLRAHRKIKRGRLKY